MSRLLFPRLALGTAILLASATGNASPADTAAHPPTTEEEKTVYALGYMMYKQAIAPFQLNASEIAILQQAMSDAAAGKTSPVKIEEYEPKVRAFAQTRAQRQAENEKAKGQAYVIEAMKKPGAVKSDSGMIYQEITAGTGASPTAADKVKVHYRGTHLDGTEFDSSLKRGQPVEFALTQVIACWTEGLQKMKVGGKATLICPSSIAYGDRGRSGIPGGATLIFEVELLDIVKAEEKPAAAPAQ